MQQLLYEYKDGQFLETEESGKPVLGCGEIRSGLLELSNADFKANISYYQMAKMQMEVVNKLISSNKRTFTTGYAACKRLLVVNNVIEILNSIIRGRNASFLYHFCKRFTIFI